MKTITTTPPTPNSKDTASQERPESSDARSAPGTKATPVSSEKNDRPLTTESCVGDENPEAPSEMPGVQEIAAATFGGYSTMFNEAVRRHLPVAPMRDRCLLTAESAGAVCFGREKGTVQEWITKYKDDILIVPIGSYHFFDPIELVEAAHEKAKREKSEQ